MEWNWKWRLQSHSVVLLLPIILDRNGLDYTIVQLFVSGSILDYGSVSFVTKYFVIITKRIQHFFYMNIIWRIFFVIETANLKLVSRRVTPRLLPTPHATFNIIGCRELAVEQSDSVKPDKVHQHRRPIHTHNILVEIMLPTALKILEYHK